MKKVFVQLESGRGYGRDLLKGIYEYNNRYSQWEIVFEPAYYIKTNESRDIVKMVKLMKPDGCIIEHIENLDTILDLKVPFIQANWSQQERDFPCLKGNYEADGKMAVDYFLNLGFRKLAFFGVKNLVWSDYRYISFKEHAENLGVTVYDYVVKLGRKKSLKPDFKHIISWLKSLPKPIGILCCNDDFGLMLVNACSMGKFKIPYEIAILGIDNDELMCNLTYPNLSSIARNHSKAAFTACEMLQKMMDGEAIKDKIIPTEPIQVVQRTSTDTIACNDAEVTGAPHYIRDNIHLPINVADVVKSTNISRRSLYTRFKAVTGKTIHEDIQFQKLQKFKELLRNQNLSVKEVAFRLGFNDVSHVSRWFSAIDGMPPVKWRIENC